MRRVCPPAPCTLPHSSFRMVGRSCSLKGGLARAAPSIRLKVLRKLIVELEDWTRIYAPINLWIHRIDRRARAARALLGQNVQMDFAITVSFNVLTVSVTFSLSTGGVSVGLGVGKTSTPVGTLTISSGSWQLRYMAKVESYDGSYILTRCNWVSP